MTSPLKPLDFGAEEIIHYPSAADFGKWDTVNSDRSRTALAFDKSVLENEDLESALGNPDKNRYAHQLTGLQVPSVLVEVGEYFCRSAKLLFPWSGRSGADYSKKRAAWLGCDNKGFTLGADDFLSYEIHSRPVSLSGTPQVCEKKIMK